METSVTSSLLSRRPSYFSYDSTDKDYKAQVNNTHTCTYIYKYSMYMDITSSLCMNIWYSSID